VRLAFLYRRSGRRGQLAQAAADLAREAGEGHVLYAGVEAGTARALAELVRGCPDLAAAQHRIVTYWRRQDDDATAR
jgi:NADPH-dependent ferric siderophore reductase